MKITVLISLLALLAVATAHQQLRRHDFPFLDSMTDNPLKMAQFMSGDYVSILPSFLQPIARKIFNQEQSGTSAMLDQASRLFGGGGNSGSGMFGGMGDLFGSVSGDKNNGILDSFKNSFGGSNNNNNRNNGGFLDSLTGIFN